MKTCCVCVFFFFFFAKQTYDKIKGEFFSYGDILPRIFENNT